MFYVGIEVKNKNVIIDKRVFLTVPQKGVFLRGHILAKPCSTRMLVNQKLKMAETHFFWGVKLDILFFHGI